MPESLKIRIKVLIHKTDEPAGRGIGPVLETREALRVLQQKPNRPLDLEQRSLNIATELLKLCLKDSDKELKEIVKENYGTCSNWAKKI